MPRIYTRGVTTVLAIAHTVFCLAWILPLHGRPGPGPQSGIRTLASLFPVWAAGFGITAVLLWLSFRTVRMAIWGHGVGGVFLLAYGSGALVAALTIHPPGSILTPTAFLTLAVLHLVVQRAYRRGL